MRVRLGIVAPALARAVAAAAAAAVSTPPLSGSDVRSHWQPLHRRAIPTALTTHSRTFIPLLPPTSLFLSLIAWIARRTQLRAMQSRTLLRTEQR